MIRKNPQGIPFVTDGTTRKWCMAIFQEQAPSPAGLPPALPSLEVTEDDSKASSNSSAPGPPRMPLAGVVPQTGIWGLNLIHFFLPSVIIWGDIYIIYK